MNYGRFPKTISQSMLAAFARQHAAMREDITHHNQVRQRLIESLDAGAKTEPGALILNVEIVQTRRFTYANVLKQLGEEHTAWLKSRITPKISRRLTVYQRFDGDL
jgi:hypothetical protein